MLELCCSVNNRAVWALSQGELYDGVFVSLLQAWRKRWFVLRRGRMSGNPDVLEYYQSKNSKKPIRIIDLKECEVETPSGQLRIKRDFHGKHLFVVKTSARIFYLVAKTEEEMNDWINNISQICHFGSLDDAGKYRAN